MSCTATTRLTAEECLARLDALRPMPRGLRLEAYAEDNHGVPWCQNRNPLWLDLYDGDGIPQRVSQKGAAEWPDPKVIRAYAAPVRRLREERRALRDSLSRTQTALARLQRELAGATERLGQHLYCVEHEQFDCTMVCAAALREALSDVTGRPCEKQGRWCHTHQCKDCSIDDARKLLGEP